MSSSTFSTYQPALDDGSRDRLHNGGTLNHTHPASTSPFGFNHLSPYGPAQTNSASTPADSQSAFSEQYQSSDFSEFDADPFFGVDFSNAEGGTPSFLDEQPLSSEFSSEHGEHGDAGAQPHSDTQPRNASGWHAYPLSPDATNPSVQTTSPGSEYKSLGNIDVPLPYSVSPRDLSRPPRSTPINTNLIQAAFQPSPDTNNSGRSSEDSLGPSTSSMSGPSPSPRVTVSMWGKDQVHHIDNVFPESSGSPTTLRAGISADDSFIPASYQGVSTSRDEEGAWIADSRTGQRGLNPERRPEGEVTSVNELDSRRIVGKRNEEVDSWITNSESLIPPDAPRAVPTAPYEREDDGISSREIPTGDQTENKPLPGQTYFMETGGAITEEDLEIMRQNRLGSDAPMMYGIFKGSRHFQPASSHDAILEFERLCRDNDSVVSRAATWGTRRRSLPSIADIEGITSGNFLKKLSLNRERKPSIFFKELRGLVRRPSTNQLLKRGRSYQDEEASSDVDSINRRESQSSLAPPTRTTSWGKNKQQMPSLNTALVSMATNAAAIGTQHARTSSISNVTSPKSPFNLQVKNTLRRPRSKSDLPRGTSDESHPHLVGMWKKSGGPPVAQLSKGAPAGPADRSDDEDEEEESFEETDVRMDANKLIDVITPNFAGFQQHVLKMNPKLADQNSYLVDRIAHQQIVRYKSLLHNKVKHLQNISHRNCPCGPMCIGLGGSATILDVKGDARGLDPLSTRYDGSDGDLTPLEGSITMESFPPDIPMPPTNTLPAEFECQLCYQAKKFTKPSDWTKHVHEDVQPFTCTWDRCRDPKIFKRKADWVRHENEGHRHLEWWTCDVDDCRHTCYRRDNFLQHLVREHKFPEPKVKTKAAIKRAGGSEPTWQKVEQCHEETKVKPQEEPCRFCGKTFPTWKKLTVHLAKHMENLSLPVLKLVARKELEPDTIISPVQDPPPRTFAPLPPVKNEAPDQSNRSPNIGQPLMQQQQQTGVFAYSSAAQQDPYAYQAPAQSAFHNPFYGDMHGLPQQVDTMPIGLQQGLNNNGFHTQAQAYQHFPVSTGSYVASTNQYITIPSQQLEPFPTLPMNPLGLQDAAGNQIYDGMMDPVSAGGEHYTPQGSVSPFSHSPHQRQGGFYGHQ